MVIIHFYFQCARMTMNNASTNGTLNKKEFHGSKPPTALNLVNVNQILISDKFKHSDKGFKYFIGYQNDDIIRPLCIILPQMSGCVKYFENGG